MYRLVAYHNLKTERESLDFGRDLGRLKDQAEQLNPKDYPNMHLKIENNGTVVTQFYAIDGKFKEVNNDKK